MANYIETKVRYDKILDNGKVKKVTDSYLVDALSFTEAEARTIEEASQFISGGFSVSAVKKTNIAEVFYGKPNKFYKAKVVFVTLDDKTNTEKRRAVSMLVQALNLKDAYDCLNVNMRGTLSDYEVVSITETPITEVITPRI